MGQGGSKVVVQVQLDSPYYYTGDRVTGSVVLHVPQQIEVKSINVKVSGVEKCEWKERKQSGKVTHVETHKGKQVVLKHKLPLFGAGALQPGGYQWPIAFDLPHNLPGTFHYQCDTTRASIEYKVKADVDQEGFLKPDFKHAIKFEVLQRTKVALQPGPAAPPRVASVDQPISSWCCFNKGRLRLTAGVDADSYLPGQPINASAQVDNHSSAQVALVEFALHQRLRLVAQTFFGDRHKKVDTVRLISRQQAMGGTAGAPGLTSHYAATLALDNAVEATCLGKAVQSTYELVVTARTGCCLTEAALKQPVIVNDPQPLTQGPAPRALVAPPGWAPQVYPTVAFSLPAPEAYGCCALAAPAAPAATGSAGPAGPQAWGNNGAASAAAQQPGAPPVGGFYPAAPPSPPGYQAAPAAAGGSAQLFNAAAAGDWAYQQQQYAWQQQQQYQQQQHQQPAGGPPPAGAWYQAALPAAAPGTVCYVGQPGQWRQGQQPAGAKDGGAQLPGGCAGPPPVHQQLPMAASMMTGWGSGAMN